MPRIKDSNANNPVQPDIFQETKKPKLGRLDISHRNVPLNERINTDITPEDPDFILMEQYFNTQLRESRQSIRDILQDHFSRFEIEQFTPAEKDPMAAWQKEQEALCLNLLVTTFKGKLLTLPCKMAMLYFGLPVLPMKMPLKGQELSPVLSDLSHDDKASMHHPLDFLDDYQDRNDSASVENDKQNEPHIHLFNKQDFSIESQASACFPCLRGGNMEDHELVDFALSDNGEDESGVPWNAPVENKTALTLRGGALSYDEVKEHAMAIKAAENSNTDGAFGRLYGRQGQTGFGPSWADFVKAVSWILGKDPKKVEAQNGEVRVCLDLFDKSTKQYVTGIEGIFYLNPAQYDDHLDDPILQFMTNNMTKGNYSNRACFVRHVRDQRPSSYEPDGKTDGVISIQLQSSQCLKSIYMRIISSPTIRNPPSQYASELNRALVSLLQGMPQHSRLLLQTRSGERVVQDSGHMYIGQNPSYELTNSLIKVMKDRPEASIMVTVEDIYGDDIPILTSWRRDITSKDRGIAAVIPKHKLSDICYISDMIIEYNIDGRGDKDEVHHVELYVPAQGLFSGTQPTPVVCHYEDGNHTPPADQWISQINRFKGQHGTAFDTGFSIWGRPVFHEYTLVNIFDKMNPAEYTLKELLNLDLESFKLVVTTYLFPQDYDGYNRNHVLFLQTGDEITEPEFVVRFDTPEIEWQCYRNQISFNRININLADDHERYEMEKQTRWSINPKSYWGPCYDQIVEDHNASLLDMANSYMTSCRNSSSGLRGTANRAAPGTRSVYQGGINLTGLRQQAYWKPPSIFANPFRPLIPPNASSTEPRLRVGSRAPTVTIGIRTPTEMAQLEKEVHTLRNLLLSRTRQCPYADCGRVFEYKDEKALEIHVQEDHAILRCPYCVATGCRGPEAESELYFRDPDRAMQHFREKHWRHMLTQAGFAVNSYGVVSGDVPSIIMSNKERRQILADYKHCHQCGRDKFACHDRRDRQNHNAKCKNKDGEPGFTGNQRGFQIPEFCVYCGTSYFGSCVNSNCVGKQGTIDTPPEICCKNCGLAWSSYSPEYVAKHKGGCRILHGKTWDYCGFCGIAMFSMDFVSRISHAEHCEQRPRPRTIKCTQCAADLDTPQQVVKHLSDAHNITEDCLWCDQKFPAQNRIWKPAIMAQHFAAHMGAHPQIPGIGPGNKVNVSELRCPGFLDCGVIVTDMTSEQYCQHMEQSHIKAKNKPAQPNGQMLGDIYTQECYTRQKDMTSPISVHSSSSEATDPPFAPLDVNQRYEQEPNSGAREPSPDWKLTLRSLDDPGWLPDEDMRCSRCFQLAPLETDPNREYEVALHSDPDQSCSVRCARGADPTIHPVPNRSGWIRFPWEFDFKTVRRLFYDRYPAYVGTIFPVSDDRVNDVYETTDPEQMRGTPRDTVFNSPVGREWVRHRLPWPPHPGAKRGYIREDNRTRVSSTTTQDKALHTSKGANPSARMASGVGLQNYVAPSDRDTTSRVIELSDDFSSEDDLEEAEFYNPQNIEEQNGNNFDTNKSFHQSSKNHYNFTECDSQRMSKSSHARMLFSDMDERLNTSSFTVGLNGAKKRAATRKHETASKRRRKAAITDEGSGGPPKSEHRDVVTSQAGTRLTLGKEEQDRRTHGESNAALEAQVTNPSVTESQLYAPAPPSPKGIPPLPGTVIRRSSRLVKLTGRIAYADDSSDEVSIDQSAIVKNSRPSAKKPRKRPHNGKNATPTKMTRVSGHTATGSHGNKPNGNPQRLPSLEEEDFNSNVLSSSEIVPEPVLPVDTNCVEERVSSEEMVGKAARITRDSRCGGKEYIE